MRAGARRFLVAMLDPAHINHESAHRWIAQNRKNGWATCPITLNGCARILGNPRYPSIETLAEVFDILRKLCSDDDHTPWDDTVSLLDKALFRERLIGGHQQITDVYLLGLAVRRSGRLVTFDRSIPLKAVIGTDASCLVVLGAE